MVKCPGCGAAMRFEPSKQQLVCDFCDSCKVVIEAKDGKGVEEKNDVYNTTVFTCPDCGAQILNNDETAVTFCSFCGNPVTLKSKLAKMRTPGLIVPFRLTHEEAIEKYKDYIKKAVFAPSRMIKDEKVEKFRGIYMPYWVYSVKQTSPFTMNAKKEHRSGDYIIKETFRYSADVDSEYKGISFDASSQFSDDVSKSISPFMASEGTEFAEGYMAGFYGDVTDVAASVYTDEAEKIAKDDMIEKICRDKLLSGVSPDKGSARFSSPLQTEDDLAYFPVWFLANRYDDKVSYAAINGQTGRIACDIPIDYSKFLIITLLVSIPIMLLLDMLFTFRPVTMLIASVVFSLISIFTACIESMDIYKRDNNLDDKGLLSKKNDLKGKKESNIPFKQLFGNSLLPLISIILCVLIFIIDPVLDYWYYGGIMVSLVMTLASFYRIIRLHNELSLRKPPQFNKRGGDEE